MIKKKQNGDRKKIEEIRGNILLPLDAYSSLKREYYLIVTSRKVINTYDAKVPASQRKKWKSKVDVAACRGARPHKAAVGPWLPGTLPASCERHFTSRKALWAARHNCQSVAQNPRHKSLFFGHDGRASAPPVLRPPLGFSVFVLRLGLCLKYSEIRPLKSDWRSLELQT